MYYNNMFSSLSLQVESFPPEVEVRAVLESQFLARLMYAQACGLTIGKLPKCAGTPRPAVSPLVSSLNVPHPYL